MNTRYALSRLDRTAHVCPEVGDVVGFADPVAAMLHAFALFPADAHLWEWVPLWPDQPRTEEPHRAGV